MRNGRSRSLIGLAAMLALMLVSNVSAASSPIAAPPVTVDASVKPIEVTNGESVLEFTAVAHDTIAINYQLGMFVFNDSMAPPRPMGHPEFTHYLGIESEPGSMVIQAGPAMMAGPMGAGGVARMGSPHALEARAEAAIWTSRAERIETTYGPVKEHVVRSDICADNATFSIQGPKLAWGAARLARLEPGREETLKVLLRAPEVPADRAQNIRYVVRVWSDDPAQSIVVPVGQRYEPQEGVTAPAPTTLVAQENMAAVLAGVAAAAGVGGWKWLRSREWSLPLPWPLLWLFTRLQRSTLLDQPTRRQVHDLIEANPGIRFSDLRRQSRLATGVITHHLRMLEDHGLVRSVLRGRQRHLYAKGTAPERGDAGLTEKQQAILALLRAGGLSQRQIAQRLGVSQQTVSYHARRLQAMSVIVPLASGGPFTQRVAGPMPGALGL